MTFGCTTKVEDPDQKREKLTGLIETLYPGRSDAHRPMTESGIKATTVLSLPIEEASAKIRDQGAVDDDYGDPVWSSVIRIKIKLMKSEPNPHDLDGVETPKYLQAFTLE